MTNDLLERLEAAVISAEPFEGDRFDRVACYAAGQAFRRAALGLSADADPPSVETERFRADTTAVPAGTHVFPATWTYARRHSLAFQVARVLPMAGPKVVAASLTPTGLPTVRWQTSEGDAAAISDPVWEATPVEIQAKTAVVWSIASGELVEDISGPLSGDGVAQLGQIFLDALLDEIDRVYLEGDTAGTDQIDGVIKKAGASATAATSPKSALEALNPAAITTVVWVLSVEAFDSMKTSQAIIPATIGALDSLSQLAELPTIGGSIGGRPAVVVAQDWLGTVKGVVGAFKRATVVGLRTAPAFEATGEFPEAWTAGGVAIRAMARFGVGVVQPTMICKLT
jgi:HK97 family phage major capsid protein